MGFSPWGPKESDTTKRLTLSLTKWINDKDLLFSTGNYIPYLVITSNGKESEKEIYIYICARSSKNVYC